VSSSPRFRRSFLRRSISSTAAPRGNSPTAGYGPDEIRMNHGFASAKHGSGLGSWPNNAISSGGGGAHLGRRALEARIAAVRLPWSHPALRRCGSRVRPLRNCRLDGKPGGKQRHSERLPPAARMAAAASAPGLPA
jgi:hypothetical protein